MRKAIWRKSELAPPKKLAPPRGVYWGYLYTDPIEKSLFSSPPRA